jgi:hypothetical protein
MDDNQPVMKIDQGTKKWMVDGKFHREDGPAVEWEDGTKEWVINNQLHRTAGPAVEWASGRNEWCLYNKKLSFDEWLDQNNELTGEEKVMYKLKYG